MQEKQSVIIILPEKLADLPVLIIRGTNTKELIFNVCSAKQSDFAYADTDEQHILVWHNDKYLKLLTKEIIWLEADGSYCNIYMTQERKMTISFPLASAQKVLPSTMFIRIHRSYIVNIKHVTALRGNSFYINNITLNIGRGFRKLVLGHFIFMGVRKAPK